MVIFGEDVLVRIISDVRGRHQVDELIDLAQYVPIVITRIAGKIRVVELHDPPPFVSSGLHTRIPIRRYAMRSRDRPHR